MLAAWAALVAMGVIIGVTAAIIVGQVAYQKWRKTHG